MKDHLEILVTYFTDPLCCYSWVFEKEWKKFINQFHSYIDYKYVMGGLLPNWNIYNDPINLICKPSQMGPLWMELSQKTGIPIASRIWVDDAPASSYPSCIAFKAAEIQSPKAGEEYLLLLRKTVMTDGQNISKNEVLLQAAKTLQKNSLPSFDCHQFKEDYLNGKALDLFRKDHDKINYLRIQKFPTITIERIGKKGIILKGLKSFEDLQKALHSVAPEIEVNTI